LQQEQPDSISRNHLEVQKKELKKKEQKLKDVENKLLKMKPKEVEA